MAQDSSSAVSRRTMLKAAAAIAGAGVGVALLGSSVAGTVPGLAPDRRAPSRPGDAVMLKIGVLLPSAEAYPRPTEGLVAGLQLGFATVDDRMAGRAVEVLVEREGATAAERDAALHRLFVEQDVPVAIGDVGDSGRGALSGALRATRAVMLHAVLGGEGLARARDVAAFQLAFTPWQLSFPLGDWAYWNLARRVYVTATDTPFGRRSAEAFRRGFAHAGVAVVAESYVAPGHLDFADELGRIGRARAEATYACYVGAAAVAFVHQYAAAGLNREVRLVGPGLLTEDELLPEQGRAALGAISSLHWTPALDTAENMRFRRAFEQRYARTPDLLALHGYDAARVVIAALQHLGGATDNRDRLRGAIAGVRLQSPRGPFRFDSENRAPIQDVYVRDVKEQNGILSNVVLETARGVREPGRTAQGG
jgi:branched-chain amino acid transport system substrate-binding protein